MNSLRKTVARKTIISLVAVASAVAFAAPVSAEYPPIEDVRPSTSVKEVSYDRSPRTVSKVARRLSVNSNNSALRVYIEEAVVILVPGQTPSTRHNVSITTPRGKKLDLPTVRSFKNGTLRLPTIAMAISGVYTVKIVSPAGTRSVSVNVVRD